MKPYVAAAIQLQSGLDVDRNLAQARKQIELAVEAGARLVGLPENFALLKDDRVPLPVAEARSVAEASEKFLETTARHFGITLLGGGFPVPADDGRVFNTALLIDSTGSELARYRKVHLFDVALPEENTYSESTTVKPGSDPPPIYSSEELGVLGLSICYDLRFPELYRHLSSSGAEVLLIPAAFTAYTGKSHWELLLRARAVENTCYVVAPAQTGLHYGNRRSHGHAMIVDPWGNVLDDAGTEPGFASARIDPARLAEVRHQLPSLKHRVLS